MTKAKAAAINAAYAELEAATNAYQEALNKFQKVYDPTSTDIDQMGNLLGEFLFNVDQELDEVI